MIKSLIVLSVLVVAGFTGVAQAANCPPPGTSTHGCINTLAPIAPQLPAPKPKQ
jgi:hypothetical protein